MASISQYLRLAGLLASELWARAAGRLGWAMRFAIQRLDTFPDRLVIAPQDIRTSDPTIAEDIYAGYFAFAGRIVNSHGRSPFDIDPPTANWARGLYGFAWLRHLRSADTVLARANARALVDDYIAAESSLDALAREPAVAARRLISMLSQSPVILDGADRAFYRRFIRHLALTQARLHRQLDGGAAGATRLQIVLALAFYALCAQVPARSQRNAAARLEREIRAQILPDGGHASRNPRLIVDFLMDFLPLRQAYAARGLAAPGSLMNAIDRMMPMLRMFRHGDGALALFNGMGVTAPHALAIALAYDDAHAQPNSNARYSGYQRFDAAGIILLFDVGGPPRRQFSREAHAGCLAFELSDGDQRLIVNCGAPDSGRIELRLAARSTAAHSTLTVADASAGRFARTGGIEALLAEQMIEGAENVTFERTETSGAVIMAASHDGYARRFGLVHGRTLRIALNGADVSGEDRLTPSRGAGRTREADFAIRFHLHPNVAAHMENDGSVRLQLGAGRAWRFSSAGHAAALQESVLFASANGARAARQIVLSGRCFGEARVQWSLERLEA